MKKTAKRLIACVTAFTVFLSQPISLRAANEGKPSDTGVRELDYRTRVSHSGSGVNAAHGIVKKDNSLWTWGPNNWGQLGNGSFSDVSTPEKVMDDVVSAVISHTNGLAVKEDDSLWMWGNNQSGTLGIESPYGNHAEPVQVMDEVAQASTGNLMSFAVKKDGSLWFWGANDNGIFVEKEITEEKKIYHPVKLLDNVQKAVMGSGNFAAITTDGTLLIWGRNDMGQLLDETTEDSPVPSPVMDGVADVSVGENGTFAVLKTDGTLWFWGENGGKFGNGTRENSTEPVMVMEDVKMADTFGTGFSAVVKNDGTLWTTGGDSWGALGNGTEGSTTEFVKIMDEVECVKLSDFSFAVKKDGSVWVWGFNEYSKNMDGAPEAIETPLKYMEPGTMLDRPDPTISDTQPSREITDLELFTEYPQYLSNTSVSQVEQFMWDATAGALDEVYKHNFLSSYQYALKEGGTSILLEEHLGILCDILGLPYSPYERLYDKLLKEQTQEFISDLSEKERYFDSLKSQTGAVMKELKGLNAILEAGDTINVELWADALHQAVPDLSKKKCISLLKQCESDFGRISKDLKKLNSALSVGDILVTGILLLETDKTLIGELKEECRQYGIQSELYRGLDLLEKEISLNENTPAAFFLEKFFSGKALGWISGQADEKLLNLVSRFWKSGSAGEEAVTMVAQLVVAGTAEIMGLMLPNADKTIKATIQRSFTDCIRARLITGQQITFLEYKNQGVCPDDIEDQIEKYKILYGTYLKSLQRDITLTQKLVDKPGYTRTKQRLKDAQTIYDKYSVEKYLEMCKAQILRDEATNLKGIPNGDGTFTVTGYALEETPKHLVIPHEVLGYPVSRIADNAFLGDTNIQTLVIEAEGIAVGSQAFRGCTNLTEVYIGSAVHTVEASAFADCTGLAVLSMGEGIREIGEEAFANCVSLGQAEIPYSTATVGARAFAGCTALEGMGILSENAVFGEQCFENAPLAEVAGVAGTSGEVLAEEIGSAFVPKEPKVESISVSKLPDKLEYRLFDDADTAGMELTVQYGSGASAVIREGWTAAVTGRTVGESSVQVFYGDQNTSYPITILPDKVSYTVHYVDENGRFISPSVTREGTAGETVREAAIAIQGYEADVPEAEFTLGIYNNELHLTYHEREIKELSTASVTSLEKAVYTGKEIKPSVTVKDEEGNILIEGTDYTLSYRDNKNPGTGKIVITGKGSWTGTVMKEFVIYISGTWRSDARGWWYAYAHGGYPKSKWELIEGRWYYFDEGGYRMTGWIRPSGTWYYLNSEGIMQTGWVKFGNTWYYLNRSGAMQTGWVKDGNTWFYLNGSGAMQTGWARIGGTWYYLNGSGAMQTGWAKIGGTWYYLNGSGAMQTGWMLDGKTWYYLSGSGAMQTGWLKTGGTWYYLSGSGAMQTGWQRNGGTWYYLNGSGAMQKGWVLDGKTWYYLSGSGAMQTGWLKIGRDWYYFNGGGAMAVNTWVGNSYVGADGRWVR